MATAGFVRDITPQPTGRRHFSWDRGTFDTARRTHTPEVEGVIHLPHHLLFLTLSGGADRLDVETECGHRHVGTDRAGLVSFMPAGRTRRFRLRNVEAAWATISLSPDLFIGQDGTAPELGVFTNVPDAFLSSMIGDFVRLQAQDGGLDLTYCDAMSAACAQYFLRRAGAPGEADIDTASLPRWKLRRVVDYIEANLARPIRIAELAQLAEASEGHFHRAFRSSTGQTPLRFITDRRVRRAEAILRQEPDLSIAALALRVGFLSPSHFARTYRALTGQVPSQALKTD